MRILAACAAVAARVLRPSDLAVIVVTQVPRCAGTDPPGWHDADRGKAVDLASLDLGRPASAFTVVDGVVSALLPRTARPIGLPGAAGASSPSNERRAATWVPLASGA